MLANMRQTNKIKFRQRTPAPWPDLDNLIYWKYYQVSL